MKEMANTKNDRKKGLFDVVPPPPLGGQKVIFRGEIGRNRFCSAEGVTCLTDPPLSYGPVNMNLNKININPAWLLSILES